MRSKGSYFTVEFVKDLIQLKLWYVWHLVAVQKVSFIDSLGWVSFAEKHVMMFKADGEFPFAARSCRCAISVLWDHLHQLREEI